MKSMIRMGSAVLVAAALAMAGCAQVKHMGEAVGIHTATKVSLSGAQEVPPVDTKATGSGSFKVASDGSISGTVDTTGIEGLAAHIHMGAAGENGPVIVPLTKGDGGSWSTPAGAKLTDAQMQAYKDGKLYVNVHSAAHKGGEIRSQLMP